jgi:hypothetical protein
MAFSLSILMLIIYLQGGYSNTSPGWMQYALVSEDEFFILGKKAGIASTSIK